MTDRTTTRRRGRCWTPRRGLQGALTAAALGVLLACGGAVPEEPVARVELQPSELRLAWPETATLETVWRPRARLPAESPDLVVFVHLLDGSGEVVRTFDHPFPGEWAPGETVRDPVELWQSALAPPLPPGRYRLTLGLVSVGEERRRWPLALEGSGGERVGREEYVAATVVVPPAPAPGGGPDVTFTGAWGAQAERADRQVLVSRPLEGAGAVVLRGLEAPLEVGLGLELPRADEAGRWVSLAEGTDEVSATLRSPCAAEAVRVRGGGQHRVRLLLDPPAGGGDCPIRIEPGFTVVDAETLARIPPVQLLRLTWSAAPR